MPLYHAELGIPETTKRNLPNGSFRLEFTGHAKQEIRNDRFNIGYFIPADLNTNQAKLIEVETDHQGRAIKLLYRMVVSTKLHLCFVVMPNGKRFKVKTVWGQDANDNHESLNRSRYSVVH